MDRKIDGLHCAFRTDADHARPALLHELAYLLDKIQTPCMAEAQNFAHHRYDNAIGPRCKRPVYFALKHIDVDFACVIERCVEHGQDTVEQALV